MAIFMKFGDKKGDVDTKEYKGWIQADRKASENNRRAKYYSLALTGRKQLGAEIESWDCLAGAVALILDQG